MSTQKTAIIKNPPFPRNYAEEFLILDHGKGVYLYDAADKEYLDFGSGIAVNALGYGREDLADIMSAQMRRLIHVSNLWTTRPALELAGFLTGLGDFAAVHFGNSGTEANEAALKYARAYALRTKGKGHHKILSFSGAFHGRTMGALSVTPTPKYQDSCQPLIPGVETAEFNNAEDLEAVLSPFFAAVIVEPVQGEGGLNVMTPKFAKKLNQLCRKHDIILIADEVQTGLGRTGCIFASEAVGLEPDIVALAKPLAGGLPMSATLIPAKVNDQLHLGDHGTTFGGGPAVSSVALEVVKKLTDSAFLKDVQTKSRHLEKELQALSEKYEFITGCKGIGMLRGISLDIPEGLEADYMGKLLAELRSEGLLALRSGKNILRLAPPLVATNQELSKGCEIIAQVFDHFSSIM